AVDIEHVVDSEPADLNGEPRYVLLAGQLAVAALDGLLLAAELEGLAQEQARRAVVRVWEIRLLRLAVGKPSGAGGVVQAEALQQLGIVIELAAVPEPQGEKGAHGPGISRLRPGREAVLAEVGRAEGRVALLDERGLPVNLPIIELGLRPVVEAGRVGRRRKGMIVEPEANKMGIERG